MLYDLTKDQTSEPYFFLLVLLREEIAGVLNERSAWVPALFLIIGSINKTMFLTLQPLEGSLKHIDSFTVYVDCLNSDVRQWN